MNKNDDRWSVAVIVRWLLMVTFFLGVYSYIYLRNPEIALMTAIALAATVHLAAGVVTKVIGRFVQNRVMVHLGIINLVSFVGSVLYAAMKLHKVVGLSPLLMNSGADIVWQSTRFAEALFGLLLLALLLQSVKRTEALLVVELVGAVFVTILIGLQVFIGINITTSFISAGMLIEGIVVLGFLICAILVVCVRRHFPKRTMVMMIALYLVRAATDTCAMFASFSETLMFLTSLLFVLSLLIIYTLFVREGSKLYLSANSVALSGLDNKKNRMHEENLVDTESINPHYGIVGSSWIISDLSRMCHEKVTFCIALFEFVHYKQLKKYNFDETLFISEIINSMRFNLYGKDRLAYMGDGVLVLLLADTAAAQGVVVTRKHQMAMKTLLQKIPGGAVVELFAAVTVCRENDSPDAIFERLGQALKRTRADDDVNLEII